MVCIISWKTSLGYDNSRYDKSINVFSPEGDLLQVAYAELAGERGATVVCIPTEDDGFILCMEGNPKQNILLDKRAIDKISKVDDSTWLSFSGLAGDGRSIIRQTREFCNDFHLQYGVSPAVSVVAKHIGEIQHKATLVGSKYIYKYN